MKTLNDVKSEEKRRAKMLIKSFNRITSLDGGLTGQQSINVAREFMNQLGIYTPAEWKPTSAIAGMGQCIECHYAGNVFKNADGNDECPSCKAINSFY